MRISDWSSDVCSSDLACARFAREYGEPGVELYFGLFDDNKIAYMQGTQHMLFDLVGRLRHVVPVQLAAQGGEEAVAGRMRSEEHTSELQSLMRNSYAVFCLKKKKTKKNTSKVNK